MDMKTFKKTAKELKLKVKAKAKAEEIADAIKEYYLENDVELECECPNCENDIPDAKTCPFCGVSFDEEETEDEEEKPKKKSGKKDAKKSGKKTTKTKTKGKTSGKKRGAAKGQFDYKELVELVDGVCGKFKAEKKERANFVSYWIGTTRVFHIAKTTRAFTIDANFVIDVDGFKTFSKKEIESMHLGGGRGSFKTEKLSEMKKVVTELFTVAKEEIKNKEDKPKKKVGKKSSKKEGKAGKKSDDEEKSDEKKTSEKKTSEKKTEKKKTSTTKNDSKKDEKKKTSNKKTGKKKK